MKNERIQQPATRHVLEQMQDAACEMLRTVRLLQNAEMDEAEKVCRMYEDLCEMIDRIQKDEQ